MSDKKFNPSDYMIDLRGKKYLPVAARVMWFRAENPGGTIETNVHWEKVAFVRARITIDGVVVATGCATVREGKGQTWDGREIEKAETAAIGRALALAGFGTMNAADELDDTEYLSDSPTSKTKTAAPAPEPPPGFRPGKNKAPETKRDIGTFVEVCQTRDGKNFLRVDNGATTFTREPFRRAGIACENWTTPGEKHLLEKPVTIYYTEEGNSKAIVKVSLEDKNA